MKKKTLFASALFIVVFATLGLCTDVVMVPDDPFVTPGCPVGQVCLRSPLSPELQLRCEPGYFCGGGSEGPEVCPAGYLCPDGSTKVKCPAGKYCVKGSFQAWDCPALSVCPEGSERYVWYGGMLLILAVLGLFVLLVMAMKRGWFSKWFMKRRGRVPTGNLKAESIPSFPAKFAIPGPSILLDHIRVVLKGDGQKVLLNDVSCELPSGSVSVVLGASGAGKTTLLNVLLGKINPTEGTIKLRGSAEQGTLEIKSLSGIPDVGFVPQDDIMLPSLTVRETLLHSARMRLPRGTPAAQVEEVVATVLAILGLVDVANSIVGSSSGAHGNVVLTGLPAKGGVDAESRADGQNSSQMPLQSGQKISGGQRKRVSIGMELVAKPRLLFLDEPTTGLDASTSIELMKYLHSIAHDTGVTVVAVLHQPRLEIIRTYTDNIVVLAKGGNLVYYGPFSSIVRWFEVQCGYIRSQFTNPADWVLDIINAAANGKGSIQPRTKSGPMTVSQLADIWKAAGSSYARTAEIAENSGRDLVAASSRGMADETVKAVSWFYQVWLLTNRALLQHYRDISSVALDVVLHVLTGLIIGIGFVSTNLFQPPLSSEYIPFCPPPVRMTFCVTAVQDEIGRMIVYTTMALGLAASALACRFFTNEKSVFLREHGFGRTSTSAYVVARSVADIPLILLYSLMFSATFAVVVAPSSDFGQYWSIMIMFEAIMFGLGYLCSVLLPAHLAPLLAAVATLLSGLSTGGAQSVEDMGAIGNISWARWFGEALYIVELGLEKPGKYTPTQQSVITEYVENQNYHYNLHNLEFDFLSMVLFLVAFRVLVWAVLKIYARLLKS
eukprot:ANDGO_03310.mRNA.1 ABC transporter G family member 7